jgi:hypothetical protein
MKFALPKWTLPKFGTPRPPLPAWRGLPQLRLKDAQAKRKATPARLLIGGALAIVGLGALGRFVVWPRLRPPQQVESAAKAVAIRAASAKAGGSEADGTRSAPPKAHAMTPAPKKTSQATARAAVAPAPTPASAKEPAKTQIAAVLSGSPAPPSEAERLVRQLQDDENRVAAGDPAAYQQLPLLLRTIARRFVELPPKTWADEGDAGALVLYLLSGGNSVVGRRILSEHTLAASQAPLAKGAIAYLEGIDCAERDALLDVDPLRLDVALGAQVAFVQSILLSRYDRSKAIAKLDVARLLAPGGLVEEAALRRETDLLSETADFNKFAEVARQYWSRFRSSPYAANFLRQFVIAAERVSALIKVEQWTRLDEFMDSLSVEKRRSFYLAMARTAAVAGNSVFADFAARRALALAAPDSIDRQRALLYRAAADVAGLGDTPEGDLLQGVERGRLPRMDQPLYDAVSVVAAAVRRAPERNFTSPPADAGDLPGHEFARAAASLGEASAAINAERKSMEHKSR